MWSAMTVETGSGSGMEPLVFVAILAALLGLATVATRRQRRWSVRVPARLESIRGVVQVAMEAAQQAGLGDEAAFHCHVALDEACVNIIEHAYGNTLTGEMDVEVVASDGECVIALTDYGRSYDPGSVPLPPIGTRLEDVQPGGLGLLLMRSFMDATYYTPSANGNRLVMVKRRPPNAA
jgi:serine/threonine-protein kinase RsbW